MSRSRTTFVSTLLIAVMAMAVGMVIASRFNLAPPSAAQSVQAPVSNSSPISGNLTATTFREIADAQTAIVGDHLDPAAAAAGEHERVLRRRRRVLPPVLRAAAGTGDAARRQRHHPAGGDGNGIRDRRRRSDSDQQPRHRERHEHRDPLLRRRRRRTLRSPGAGPRSPDRQRAARAGRATRPGAARGDVRGLESDGAGRLGDGDRRTLRPQPYRHRRGHLGARPAPALGPRPQQRDAADRCGHQPGQLRGAAAEHPRRGRGSE